MDPIREINFLPVKFSRNSLEYTIPPADIALLNRSGIRYLLTLFVEEISNSGIFEELHVSEGREKPPYRVPGGGPTEMVHEGATFRYNHGRNGKIDGLLTYEKPIFRSDKIQVVIGQTILYKLCQEVQVPGEPAEIENLPSLVATKAGLSNEDFYSWGDRFFSQYQGESRRFLTWQPDWKPVIPGQEEYLSFLLNFSPPTLIRLRAAGRFADGTWSPPVSVLSISGAPIYSILLCPVGPELISQALASTGPINRYTVWLSDGENKRISEERSYSIDAGYKPQIRQILSVNSLGGWDTLALTGEGVTTLRTEQQVAVLERPVGASPEFSELKILSIEGEHELTVSTGYIAVDAINTIRYFEEVLLSEEMYLVTDRGHRPIQLTTSSIITHQDNSDLMARTFTFRILDTVTNYSELPVADAPVARPTYWQPAAFRAVLNNMGFRTGFKIASLLVKYYSDNNTLVVPTISKPNVPSDSDYQPPVPDTAYAPGTTPYPSYAGVGVGRKPTNCSPTHTGVAGPVSVPAGKYGGESQDDSNALAQAELEFLKYDQGVGDSVGTCVLSEVTVRLVHKIRMSGGMVIGTTDYGPAVSVRFKSLNLGGAWVVIPLTPGGVSADSVVTATVPVDKHGDTVRLEFLVEFAGTPNQTIYLDTRRVGGGTLRQSVPYNRGWAEIPMEFSVEPLDVIETLVLLS